MAGEHKVPLTGRIYWLLGKDLTCGASGTGGGFIYCGLEVSSRAASVMPAPVHCKQAALPTAQGPYSLHWGESWTPASEALGRNHATALWFSVRNLI